VPRLLGLRSFFEDTRDLVELRAKSTVSCLTTEPIKTWAFIPDRRAKLTDSVVAA